MQIFQYVEGQGADSKNWRAGNARSASPGRHSERGGYRGGSGRSRGRSRGGSGRWVGHNGGPRLQKAAVNANNNYQMSDAGEFGGAGEFGAAYFVGTSPGTAGGSSVVPGTGPFVPFIGTVYYDASVTPFLVQQMYVLTGFIYPMSSFNGTLQR